MKKAKVKYGFMVAGVIFFLITACSRREESITTGSLLDEMTDLDRLTRLPEKEYRTIQFSSYDRRSTMPGKSGWFANEDGFGNEPIPGFMEVLKPPDETGVGEYLICDIRNPGAIVRLWTAGIKGEVRLFLDDMNFPVFEGNAEDFFWSTIASLSPQDGETDQAMSLRQFDAVYFPLPFSQACRIEWTGDIRDLHFYHVGIRLYEAGTKVETFKASDIIQNARKLRDLATPDTQLTPSSVSIVPAVSTREIFKIEGSKAIESLCLKIEAEDVEAALRASVLRIYFDDASIPQVQAPLGDFFGSAPGVNPCMSLPFSVMKDSSMHCRFIMPFRHSARLEIENTTREDITVSWGLSSAAYQWEEEKSMYFHAGWQINHHVTAANINESGEDVSDILYLKAKGKGRLVGAAAFLYNPSSVPTSWGNWWGEGDEKIFVDQDTFPSFFGTGSEDYFNYSWSSPQIFSYLYCGQARNDGPGNRGYVSNFRWHILDDIPFRDSLSFYMELGHHGTVPNFSYGRIVYFYARPGLLNGHPEISKSDLRQITYLPWSPEAYLGSAGFRFIQAEHLFDSNPDIELETGNFWAEGAILMWSPAGRGEKIGFQVEAMHDNKQAKIGFTLLHGPEGGSMIVRVNGKPVKFRGKDVLNLKDSDRWALDNYFSEPIPMRLGMNEITLESAGIDETNKIGIDFFWIKEP